MSNRGQEPQEQPAEAYQGTLGTTRYSGQAVGANQGATVSINATDAARKAAGHLTPDERETIPFDHAVAEIETAQTPVCTAVYHELDGWIVGYCEEVPGVNVQERTLDEARISMKEAIRDLLDVDQEIRANEAGHG